MKQELSKRFKIVDCAEAKICFGLEIARDCNKLSLKIRQSTNAVKVLKGFDLKDCKLVYTPMERQNDMPILNGDDFCSTKYRQAFGSSMYRMACSKPDVAFSVLKF